MIGNGFLLNLFLFIFGAIFFSFVLLVFYLAIVTIVSFFKARNQLAQKEETEKKHRSIKVDINWSTVDELASLPGMDIFKALKAIKYRKNKSFESLAEFTACVELEKDYANAFAERAFVNPRNGKLMVDI